MNAWHLYIMCYALLKRRWWICLRLGSKASGKIICYRSLHSPGAPSIVRIAASAFTLQHCFSASSFHCFTILGISAAFTVWYAFLFLRRLPSDLVSRFVISALPCNTFVCDGFPASALPCNTICYGTVSGLMIYTTTLPIVTVSRFLSVVVRFARAVRGADLCLLTDPSQLCWSSQYFSEQLLG